MLSHVSSCAPATERASEGHRSKSLARVQTQNTPVENLTPMLQRQSDKTPKTIRRTFEPTRIAQAMLERAYEQLVPQSVRVIDRNEKPVGKANTQVR